MPGELYTRVTERFKASGIDLNNPLDSIRPGFYPVVENIRSYTDGILQPRQGLSATNLGNVTVGKTPVHTTRRLNDPNTTAPNNYIRVVGTGDALAWWDPATNNFTQATYNASNVAFSGNPVTMIPFRPDQSVASWMYIADSSAMYKIIGYNAQSLAKGTVHQVGLPAPTGRATAELDTISGDDRIDTQAVGTWTGDATIITTASIATATRVNTTITKSLFDSGGSGWCCIVPVAMTNIGPGSVVTITSAGPISETDIIYEVYPGTAATTVASIVYDNDPTNTLTCTIVPTIAFEEIRRNAVVLLNGATYARITHSTRGPNGTVSFRCTTGVATIAVGQNLQVVSSFRTYNTTTATVGDTVVRSNLTFPTTGAGTGYIQNNTALDFTKLQSSGVIKAMTDDDYIHISIKCSDSSKVTGGRIILNCESVAATYDQNFFYRSFSANDLVPVAKGLQTAIDNRSSAVQRRILDRTIIKLPGGDSELGILPDSPDLGGQDDDPNVPNLDSSSRSQTATGDNQWSEIRFRRGDLLRSGTEKSRGYADITSIRLEFTCTAVITLQVNSIVTFGGGQLDTADLGIPYVYRYRYRCSSTGARGNYSPTVFEGVVAYRSPIVVSMATSSLPEVDKIDVERLGGALTNWTYVGTVANATASLTDNLSDDTIVSNAAFSEGDSNFQPWPVADVPFATTTTAAGTAGTTIKTTAALPVNMAKGTPMKVGSIATSYRRTISASAKVYEIADCVGSTGSLAVEIAEPLIQSQALPAFWGPYQGSFFSCGLSSASNTRTPGTLYWTIPNNPDATVEVNNLEITSSSEPLISGCVFNGRNYVWSTERMFEIQPVGPNVYIATEVPGGKGLISRWALAVGERIWYVSRDGVYQTAGGESQSITDDTLRPLFYREGSAGSAVNGFNPPDLTSPTKLRLSYYKGYLYFIYLDTAAALRCMTYYVRAEKPGWWPDVFGGDTQGITYLYGEEGAGANVILACGNDAVTGKLYSISGTSDNGAAITGHVRTQYFDAQDRRADKHWGDFILDADPNNATLNAAVFTNTSTSSSLTLTPTTMTGAARGQQIFDISSGGDPSAAYAKNIALDVTWTSTSATPKLYFWEPSYILRPESIDLRASSWDDDGHVGDKFFQGIEIDANTFGASRSVVIEYDGSTGNVADTFTVQHTNRQQKAYAFRPAFIAHTVRLHPTDGANTWALYGYKWIWQPEPPTADRWEGQHGSFGAAQFLHFKAAYIMLRSTQTVTLTVTRTEDNIANSYTIPTTAGLRSRVYVPFLPTKGKAFTFVLSSTSTGGTFRLYKPETTVLVKPWGSEEAFTNRSMIGAESGEGKAEI